MMQLLILLGGASDRGQRVLSPVEVGERRVVTRQMQ